MTRKQLSESEAFRLLQRQSQDRRVPMAKLAESIIQTDELFEAQEQPLPPASSRPLRRHLELPHGE
jgi:two-component system, response regulator PdtaR